MWHDAMHVEDNPSVLASLHRRRGSVHGSVGLVCLYVSLPSRELLSNSINLRFVRGDERLHGDVSPRAAVSRLTAAV